MLTCLCGDRPTTLGQQMIDSLSVLTSLVVLIIAVRKLLTIEIKMPKKPGRGPI